jgi:hypothetical protein
MRSFAHISVVGAFLTLFAPLGEAAPYYVSPFGSNSDPGTLAQPWGTLAHAFSKLGPGDTLYLRGGRYNEPSITLAVSGTAENPITIRNYPAEKPVIDGSYPEFRTPGNDEWVLVDAGRHIYRSKKTYPGAGTVRGKFRYNGERYSLIPHQGGRLGANGLAYLSSDNHNYDDGPRYMGPGVHRSSEAGDYIYIRLVPPTPESQYGIDYNIPNNPDPRRYAIFLAPDHAWGIRPRFDTEHVIIDGVDIAHTRYSMRGSMRNYIIRNLTVTPAGSGFHLENSQSVLIDNVVIDFRMPPWLGWTDVKGLEEPALRIRAAGIGGGSGWGDVTVRNTLFNSMFDGILATERQHNLTFVNNDFIDIWDDALQLGSGTSHVEFAYNYVGGAGPGHHGSGSADEPGTKYVHHNIIDNTKPILWTRYDPKELRYSSDDGYRNPIVLTSHAGSGFGDGDPWKLYNNTIVMAGRMVRVLNQGLAKPNDTGVPHESLNNIFMQRNIPAVPHPDPFRYDMYFSRWMRIHNGSEIFDGNAYYKVPENTYSLFVQMEDGTGVSTNYNSLGAFRGSPHFTMSQAYYPPGWESSGLEGVDPELNARYVPQNGAMQTGVDISGRGLPGVDGAYRGAVKPGTDGSQIGRHTRTSTEPRGAMHRFRR